MTAHSKVPPHIAAVSRYLSDWIYRCSSPKDAVRLFSQAWAVVNNDKWDLQSREQISWSVSMRATVRSMAITALKRQVSRPKAMLAVYLYMLQRGFIDSRGLAHLPRAHYPKGVVLRVVVTGGINCTGIHIGYWTGKGMMVVMESNPFNVYYPTMGFRRPLRGVYLLQDECDFIDEAVRSNPYLRSIP